MLTGIVSISYDDDRIIAEVRVLDKNLDPVDLSVSGGDVLRWVSIVFALCFSLEYLQSSLHVGY